MNCTGKSDCLCGCCAGVSVLTPQVKDNPPGLPAIYYRAGTWATFKESMLARLSSSDYPALSSLKTRDDDDFTIAFLDATAIVLDVLTFYQERLANESYLRTAGQLRSLTELSRLIGYQPAPGVSAATYLAFSFTKPYRPANRSDNKHRHHPSRNTGAECAGAGAKAADLRDLRRTYRPRPTGARCPSRPASPGTRPEPTAFI